MVAAASAALACSGFYIGKGASADGRRLVTDWSRREQRRALADAKRIFDELMWYVTANNRIEGDGSGATSQPTEPFSASRP